jgi:hypothetical protein
MPRFVRHEAAFAADVLPQDGRELRNRGCVDMEVAGSAAALNQRQNDVLGGSAALGGLAGESADLGFVGFDNLTSTTPSGLGRHPASLHECGAPETKRFVGHLQSAVQ